MVQMWHLSGAVALFPELATALSNPYASQLASISSAVNAGTLPAASAASAYGSLLASATPTAVPTSLAQYQSSFTQIWGANGSSWTDFLSSSLVSLSNGAGGASGLAAYLPLGSVCPGINCDMNANPAPKCTIYPKKSSSDAPYSLSEEQLREALYIPSSFAYGSNGQPILLVPGTGSYGGVNFENNFAKLFRNTTQRTADPVWLNIPGAMLADAQVSAEYIAYALNYLQCQTSTSVAVLGWSQGNIDTQWALKYWPSTRQNTTDHIAISPDYHGTILANLLCAAIPCDASVIQQDYTAQYIATLRSNGGDAAYIPTTTIYSTFDEVVEPQSDPIASAFLLSGAAQASNNELQEACPLQPAGGVYGHEGVLYNPVAVALAYDALTHDGPGSFSRVEAGQPGICSESVASGLDLEDVLLTEGLIPLAGYYLVTYEPKMVTEPPIMAYAQ